MYDPILARLIQFVKFDPLEKFDPIWTILNHFDPILDKCCNLSLTKVEMAATTTIQQQTQRDEFLSSKNTS